MKIDWIPLGESEDYDATKDVKKIIGIVQEFNEGVGGYLEELDGNVGEFNDSVGELGGGEE